MHTGGKSAIATAGNPGVFNKEASEAYNNLSSDEKQALRERSETNERLSHKGVLKEAEKRFGKIQKLPWYVNYIYVYIRIQHIIIIFEPRRAPNYKTIPYI